MQIHNCRVDNVNTQEAVVDRGLARTAELQSRHDQADPPRPLPLRTYAVEAFHRRPDLFGPEEMRQAHVLGRAPVIFDGDVVLAESGAIVEYILALYGEGRLSVPPGAPNFARYLYWLHYAEGSLMLQLLREWSLDRMLPDADNHPSMARIGEGTRLHLAMIEDALAATPYLAGDTFTAADIMMAYPFTTFRRHVRPLDLSAYSSMAAYAARLESRPRLPQGDGASG